MPHYRNKPLYLSHQASSRPELLQGSSHLPTNSTSLLLSLKVILKLRLELSTPIRTLYLHLAIFLLRPNVPLLPIIVFPLLMYVDLLTFTAQKFSSPKVLFFVARAFGDEICLLAMKLVSMCIPRRQKSWRQKISYPKGPTI